MSEALTLDAKKKTTSTGIHVPFLAPQHRFDLPEGPQSESSGLSAQRSSLIAGAEVAHDFSSLSLGSETAEARTASCTLATPRTCPFGGACHACPTRVQAKLMVGQPDDEYEREANRVAEQVMRMPEPSKQPVFSNQHSEVSSLHPSLVVHHSSLPRGIDVTPEVESQIQSLRGGGRPLSESERAFFEPRFGHDFSKVRIHDDDSRAAEITRSMNARAFTVGQDVVFSPGRCQSRTMNGLRLLAHELVHSTQQPHGPAQVARIDSDVELPSGGTPHDAGAPPGPMTPESLPNCTAVMGGRPVDDWRAGLVDAQHTFMNFKLDSSKYWLVEGGPVGTDPKTLKTGAWAKPGEWETRGERVSKTFWKDNCAAVMNRLLDTTHRYDAAGLPYHPIDGPNSNSFMEHLTSTCKDLPKDFWWRDWAWDYWTRHTRPF